ncbi:hypothetical protein ACFL2Q_19455 [Thermodesulfobacteriota bacterium]
MRIVVVCFLALAVLHCFPLQSVCEADGDIFAQRYDLPANPDTVLQEVLSRQEFVDAAKKSLWEEIRDWIYEGFRKVLRWIWSLLPGISPSEEDARVLDWILRALLIAVGMTAVLFVGYQVYRFIRRSRFGSRSRAKTEKAEEEILTADDELWRLALEKAEQGRYGEALILLFRSALMTLDAAGLIYYHPGRTNREILNSLEQGTPIRNTLYQMVPVFNRVFYGNARCGKSDYEHFLEMCSRITRRT